MEPATRAPCPAPHPKPPQITGRRKGSVDKAAGKVKEGIEGEPARKIVNAIKESKLKVQSSIQEAQVRVTGKNKDDLQKAMALVRGMDLPLELSFVNFRD